jgi:hypothetical protein
MTIGLSAVPGIRPSAGRCPSAELRGLEAEDIISPEADVITAAPH